MASSFFTWFNTFIQEKEIDLGEYFTNESGLTLQYGDVVQFIISFLGEGDQAKVKDKLVMIDFKNGDVGHFLQYVGNLITAQHKNKIDEIILGEML